MHYKEAGDGDDGLVGMARIRRAVAPSPLYICLYLLLFLYLFLFLYLYLYDGLESKARMPQSRGSLSTPADTTPNYDQHKLQQVIVKHSTQFRYNHVRKWAMLTKAKSINYD